jgi:O-antigen ligase/predicted negative regulator of RcsB-dependent stress response
VKLSRQFYTSVVQIMLLGVMLGVVIGGTNLRIISLNTRAFITGCAVVACLIVVAIFIWRRGSLFSAADYGWLALTGLTAVSVLFSPIPRRGGEHWLLTIALHLPFAYATLALYRGQPTRQFTLIYRALAGVGVYLFLLAFFHIASYFSGLNADYNPGFRLWGVLDNPAILGMFLAITVPCIVGYSAMRITRRERLLLGLWLVAALVTIIANATRSAFIATVIGTGVTIALILLAHPDKLLLRLRLRLIGSRAATLAQLGAAALLLVALLVGIFRLQSAAPDHAPASSRFALYNIALSGFAERSLFGYGASGFVTALQERESAPPFVLVPHAHNLPLDFAAEYGLVGLVGLGIFAAVCAYIAVRAWRLQPPHEDRRPLAGLIGGLVGFFAAGLLDQPFSQTNLFFVAALLLMALASRLPTPTVLPGWRMAAVLLANLGVTGLAVGLLLLYALLWNTLQPNPQTGTLQWETTLWALDRQADIDSNDPLAALQAAYAWAYTAQTDPTALTPAINRLRSAQRLDRTMSLHPLNLSVLLAQAGEQDEALAMAERATELAPEHAAAWLQLGSLYERDQRRDEAQSAYISALTYQPEWQRAAFWTETETRRASLSAFAESAAADPVAQFYRLTYAGDVAREAGDSAGAAEQYAAALALAESMQHRGQVYYAHTARGLLRLAEGDAPAARLEFLPVTQSVGEALILNADGWVYLGDVYAALGDERRMIDSYRQAYLSLTTRGIGGLRTRGDLTYAIYAFRRFGLVSDYLPGVILPDINPLQQARFDRWLTGVD